MSAYCASPEVLRARLDGRAVLVDVRSRRCFRLNDSAMAVWEGLEQCASEDILIDGLCRRFAVSRTSAAASLTLFLGHLAARDLITLHRA